MTRTSFTNKLIPLTLTYGGISYLGLLWYSDYLERQKKVLKKKFVNFGHGEVDLTQIKTEATPEDRLDKFLKECSKLVSRVKADHNRIDRIVRTERSANSISLLRTVKPIKHQIIKNGRDLKDIYQESDYETIFGMKFNHRTILKVQPQVRLQYAREYLNGLVKVKQKVDLASSCWKLNLGDSNLLLTCLNKAEEFEQKLRLEIYKHHID